MKFIIMLCCVMLMAGCQTEYVKVPMPVYIVPELPKSFDTAKLQLPEILPYEKIPQEVWESRGEKSLDIKIRAMLETILILEEYGKNLNDVYKYYQTRAKESNKVLENLVDVLVNDQK